VFLPVRLSLSGTGSESLIERRRLRLAVIALRRRRFGFAQVREHLIRWFAVSQTTF